VPATGEHGSTSLRSIHVGWLWADLWIHREDLAHAKPPELGTLVRAGPADPDGVCPEVGEGGSKRLGEGHVG
jgi:hypothetical protein